MSLREKVWDHKNNLIPPVFNGILLFIFQNYIVVFPDDIVLGIALCLYTVICLHICSLP